MNRDKINSYQVWTAVITPMNDDSTVNFDDLEKVLRSQADAGNAITILGSTGEATNLDLDERKKILEFGLGLGLDVPFMAGVGGNNVHDQKKWIEHLNTLRLDAYLVVVPYYAKPGVYGQYAWFKELMDASERPVCIYNVPGRTAKDLELETLIMLKDHKNFWAIKEASGSEDDFGAYAHAAPNMQPLSGDDLMLPAFSKLGAKGVVSVAANAWPEATAEYARQCLAVEFKDHDLWRRAIDTLFAASNPVPVKALMHAEGKISTPTLRTPMSHKDMVGLDNTLAVSKEIGEWLENQSSS